MNPGEDAGQLFGALEERAAEERAATRAEAETRVRDIEAAARARIVALQAGARRSMEKELLAEEQRLRGETRMLWRGEQLRMKRRILAEAFARAGAEVERLCGTPACAGVLRALASEAEAAVGQPCTVAVDPQKASVVAVSGDGARSADNGPRARLRKAESARETEIAAILFPRQGRT
jgi:vacuolar-type H+-ATPase subunit E/Vma4